MSKNITQYTDTISKNNKSFRKFLRACKNPNTKLVYISYMKRFLEFLEKNAHIKDKNDCDSLLNFDSEKITDCLEEWIEYLENTGITKNTITTMLAAPELFFEMNRKLWHKKLVRRGIGNDDREQPGKTPVTNKEIQSMLTATKKLRTKAIIHFLASTGIRPGALSDPILRIKHLQYMPNPHNPTIEPKYCYSIRVYDESKEGYWAFLTPEASKTIDEYFTSRKLNGETLSTESPIFLARNKSKLKPLTVKSARTIVYDLIKMAGIHRVKIGRRYDKAAMYMFRKRFNTILKLNNDVNSNIAEKLMAHKRGLDGTYLQPTREECYREFVKAIPTLTVDPNQRLKLENETKQQRIDKLEATAKENTNLKDLVKELSEKVETLESEWFESRHPGIENILKK